MSAIWLHSDGGRLDAGFTGDARDCVTRAIAIATDQSYNEVYHALWARTNVYAERRTKVAKKIRMNGTSPRNGVHKEVYRPYLAELGWTWVPTMQIGQGCTVHLRADELPTGRIIARCSKHLVAVIDGVMHDTHDPTRGGSRCVYGYFTCTP